jgi:hypothetical protein
VISSVTVDGFQFVGLDAAGGLWRVTGMTGWYVGAQDRHDRLPKAQQDGAWPSTGHADDIPISVSGTARFNDPVAAKLAARQFRTVGGHGTSEMVVIDAAGALTASVERDGKSVDWVNHFMFTWSLLLTANDPLFYGPPTYGSANLSTATPGAGRIWPRAWPTDWGIPAGVTPGAVAVANAGTAAYWPRMRIDGPAVNPVVTLVESGAWVRLNGTVLAGQWVDINAPEIRNVLLQGQVSIRHWPVTYSGDWLAVPVGGGSVAWTDDGGDPAAKLSVWGYEGAFS